MGVFSHDRRKLPSPSPASNGQHASQDEAADTIFFKRAGIVKLSVSSRSGKEGVVAHMLARNIRMEGDLVDHLLNSSEKRLARALLLLAHCARAGQARGVLPRISQTVLAEMIGTTRSRVNFFMKRFERLGFVDDDGGLTINDALLKGILQGDTVDAPQRPAG